VKIIPTKQFVKQLNALVRRNAKYHGKVSKALKLMDFDLKHPSLRLHKLKDTSEYSVSVDMKIRIIFAVEEDTLRLLEIGSHDEVY
jgi:mRNA-degrading endonuclease YafQ of YafQ-DinJ toxin-antitoxin module